MPPEPTQPRSRPTGDKLIRLADIPLTQRLAALNQVMRNTNLSTDEAIALLDLVLDPDTASARIAT